MKPTTKYILATIATIAVLSTVAFFVFRKKDDEGDNGDADTDDRFKDLIGKNVYPSVEDGFSNVRSTPEIKCQFGTGYLWSDVLCIDANVITEAKDKPFGTILSTTTDKDGKIWYKVKLKKAVDGKSEGYVRYDAVSLKP
jgi:hypothetical protein